METPVSGLSAPEAAGARLLRDGGDYRLRLDGGVWFLESKASWDSRWSLTYDGREKLITSFAATEDVAWLEIASQVISAEWREYSDATPDEKYTEMKARAHATQTKP